MRKKHHSTRKQNTTTRKPTKYAVPPNGQWRHKTIVGPSHPPRVTSQATNQIIGAVVIGTSLLYMLQNTKVNLTC